MESYCCSFSSTAATTFVDSAFSGIGNRINATSIDTDDEEVKMEEALVYNYNTGPATSINLIGERHSGTNWIADHLVNCVSSRL